MTRACYHRGNVSEGDSSITKTIALRLLALSDLHAHLRGFDYFTGLEAPSLGLARAASVLKAARAEVVNSLLFDAGDLIQGTPLGDWAVETMEGTAVHPMVEALNHLGVDAATLGNHEFNYGLERLQWAYSHAGFPVVCANVFEIGSEAETTGRPLYPPRVLLKRTVTDTNGKPHTIQVGVTGALPPQTMQWDRQTLGGKVTISGVAESLRDQARELRKEGADLVVALCHSGIGEDSDDPEIEQAAVAVARAADVDVVISGHAHMRFPGPDYAASIAVDPVSGHIHGVPTVMPGAWGSHVGVVDLELIQEHGSWRVTNTRACLRTVSPVADVPTPEDPDLVKLTQAAHEGTLRYTSRKVGHTKERLHSYLSLICPGPAEALVADAQWHCARALLDGTEFAKLPLLSVTAPFKCGGRAGPGYYTDVAAGDVSIQNAADLYIYPNSPRVVIVSGDGIRRWLDRAACIFHQMQPGHQRQVLLNPAMASYDFDTVYGLSYDLNLAKLARYDAATGACTNSDGSRIENLRFDGRDVLPTDQFAVVTNNYRVGGGGNFPGLADLEVVAESLTSIRDLLVTHIETRGTKTSLSAQWQFVPMKDTSAVFQTSPKARALGDTLAENGLMDLGDGAHGFAQFEMDLGAPLRRRT
ncbi:MAG: bifunctional 2',3'-cyclic-nucleotide 2'-phosphodiesterase/3'-nucleotidase [Pseudomonadota bacterium]